MTRRVSRRAERIRSAPRSRGRRPDARLRPNRPHQRKRRRLGEHAARRRAGAVTGTSLRSVSDDAGRFVISGISPGTYEVRTQRVGQRAVTMAGVVVRANEETKLSVVLGRAPIQVAGVVVSASRRTEKVTDAPATVTRLDVQDIENAVGNSFGARAQASEGRRLHSNGHHDGGDQRARLQHRVQQPRAAARGRPHRGLTRERSPAGLSDHGAESRHRVDRSARRAWCRALWPGRFERRRHAHDERSSRSIAAPRSMSPAGRAVSSISKDATPASWARSSATSSAPSTRVRTIGRITTSMRRSPARRHRPELNADFNTNVARGEGALVYYGGRPGGRFELSSGVSKTNTLGLTNLGRNQILGWKYGHAQLRYTDQNWFAQAYHVESRSGQTYQLNGFAQNRLRFPTISDDSVRSLSAFPDQAAFSAAELQNTFAIPGLDGSHLTWGGQWRYDDVSSKKVWLYDAKTGENVTFTNKGVYGQAEIPRDVDVQARGRRAVRQTRFLRRAVESKSARSSSRRSPTRRSASRTTAPSSRRRSFRPASGIQDFQPSIGVFGNRNGFVIKNAAGTDRSDHRSHFARGQHDVGSGLQRHPRQQALRRCRRLRVDARSLSEPVDGHLELLDAGRSGRADVRVRRRHRRKDGRQDGRQSDRARRTSTPGARRFTALTSGCATSSRRRSTSTRRRVFRRSITSSARRLTRLRRLRSTAPTAKYTLGMNFAEFMSKHLGASWVVRYVSGYDFLSGVNIGRIPAFATGDISFGYKIPAHECTDQSERSESRRVPQRYHSGERLDRVGPDRSLHRRTASAVSA